MESTPAFRLSRITAEVSVNRPLEDVFAFFSNAANLSLLTPPWVRFEILTPPPIGMQVGARIDYRLRVHGLPLRWRTRIDVWEPPHRFVDVQERGPYRWWHHEHRFERDGDATRVMDQVDYAVWGGAWVERLFVRRDVEAIFRYRSTRLRELFP